METSGSGCDSLILLFVRCAQLSSRLQAIKRDELAIAEEKERLESRRATVSGELIRCMCLSHDVGHSRI